jgi:hypothetical protein
MPTGRGASEGPREWTRWPKKWSGRSSLVARSLLRGRRGGGMIGESCHR